MQSALQGAAPRDGLAEMAQDDQQRMHRRAILFDGVKKAAEFAGQRPRRYVVHCEGGPQPPPGAKLLYLLRHGEGEHNAWRAAEQASGRKPTAKRHNVGQYPASLHDPCLTSQGMADAAAAAARASMLRPPELLVTSPMRRAIQTLLVVFADALAAGVPAIAHELCREAFQGTDPSIYDSRLSRDALAAAYPRIDFTAHVLPPECETVGDAAPIDDPLWEHCVSPFGVGSAGGMDEAAIAEHAHRFLAWLMARPEAVIAVATHSNFLLALHHACLDGIDETPQVFHTGELRVLTVSTAPVSPVSVRAHLGSSGVVL